MKFLLCFILCISLFTAQVFGRDVVMSGHALKTHELPLMLQHSIKHHRQIGGKIVMGFGAAIALTGIGINNFHSLDNSYGREDQAHDFGDFLIVTGVGITIISGIIVALRYSNNSHSRFSIVEKKDSIGLAYNF